MSWKLFTRCAKQKNIFGNIKKDWYLRQSHCPRGFNNNRYNPLQQIVTANLAKNNFSYKYNKSSLLAVFVVFLLSYLSYKKDLGHVMSFKKPDKEIYLENGIDIMNKEMEILLTNKFREQEIVEY